MSAKTIFVIIITILVTIILMKNTDEVRFWIFGDMDVPKLGVLGTMFGLGLIVGLMLGRTKKQAAVTTFEDEEDKFDAPDSRKKNLSDEDRDYIS